MGTQVDDAGSADKARAGTLVVIGTMAAIAVVSVTAVVAWARLGAGGGSEAVTSVEEVPVALADGNQPQAVPAAVADAVDLPVIGAAPLDHLPEQMLDACTSDMGITWGREGPDVEYAFITADGVVASLAGEADVDGGFAMGPGGEPGGVRARCDLELEDGSATSRGGGGLEEIFPDSAPSGGFLTSSCCDRDGLARASASVVVPEGAAWALQDRGSWFQAYEVEGLAHVGVTWRYRERRMGPGGPPASAVLFVADDGTVISETSAGGHF